MMGRRVASARPKKMPSSFKDFYVEGEGEGGEEENAEVKSGRTCVVVKYARVSFKTELANTPQKRNR